ncbi:MAG: dihydropteroate synthase [Gemmatimonadaceae bacterium]|nr:dihydropteroate synthase [Acetobacteraceae bacterium]
MKRGWAGLPDGTLVMAILNATPDSFSDGGDTLDPEPAIAAGHRMIEDGADIIDIGGESTRPGADPVDPIEEQRRILPIIAALSRTGVAISVDSRHASTMAAALQAGATIVNDVSALAHDPASIALVAARQCPVVLMHMRGTPATMRGLIAYDNVAADVRRELAERIAAAERAGIARSAIAIDPGIGFAKTAEQSVLLLRNLPVLIDLGCPILVGVSRKAFIGALGGAAAPKDRTAGSIAAALFAISKGATILRVHDVAATVQAVRVWQGLQA